MTGPDHPTFSASQVPAEPPAHDAVDRVRTTRRWAIGVLVVSTLGLAAYLAMVVASAWLVVWAMDAVTDREPTGLDLTALLIDVTPGLAVGWCVGLGAAALLARGEALGARGAGCAAGALGATCGAAVLAAGGLL